MVEFSTILQFIQATGIIVGVAYYVLNIENNRKNQELALESQKHSTDTREAQLFLSFMNSFTSPENVKIQGELMFEWQYDDFEDFMNKYGPEKNYAMFAKFDSSMSHIETLGVLVKHGLINPVIINDMIGGHITGMWEKYEPVFIGFREKYNWTQAFEQCEYLYNQIKPLRESTINISNR